MIVDGQKYITEKEVSSQFGLSLGWIRKLRYSDGFPYHKLNRKVFFNEREVEKWLKDNLRSCKN